MTRTAHGQMRFPGSDFVYVVGSVNGSGQEIVPHTKEELADAIAAKTTGAFADTAASSDTANAGIISLFKRLLTRITSLFQGSAGTPNSNVVTVQGIANGTPLLVRNLLQYYTSVDGGNITFNASAKGSGVSSTGAVVALIHNPTGSGIDIHLARIVLSPDHLGTFDRFRGGTFTATAAAETNFNRGDNQSVVAKTKVYGQGAIAIGTQGNSGKTNRVVANKDEPDDVNGSIILRPGSIMYWFYRPTTSNSNCAIELVWWELPARV